MTNYINILVNIKNLSQTNALTEEFGIERIQVYRTLAIQVLTVRKMHSCASRESEIIITHEHIVDFDKNFHHQGI